ncbi:uncharacterized protein LTR77_005835 [Saxophila tyrrhenica]|uniref:Uncharacterized protein n=1 Tax=Saxophila tyrrhenica TaxID=1690608 RepID=A0AAV9PA85_9PEZI|nr:hypothetical protein LTR77_005835 [Saxophila tyrrhenica]
MDQHMRVVPVVKLVALGFGNIQAAKGRCFHKERAIRVVGPDKWQGFDTTLVRNIQEALRAAGCPEDELAETLDPNRQYGKSSLLKELDLNFPWPEEEEGHELLGLEELTLSSSLPQQDEREQ